MQPADSHINFNGKDTKNSHITNADETEKKNRMKKLIYKKILLALIINVFLFSCNTEIEQKDKEAECFCVEKRYIPQSMLENHFNSKLFTIKCKYYDNGKIKEVNEFFLPKKNTDTTLLNQYITYDTIGNMIEDKSHLVSLITDKDTIKNGEKYNLNIKLSASYFDSYISVYIGKFNEKFILLDSNNVDSVFNDTTEVYYEIKKYTLGKNVIRGIVNDYVSYFVDNDTTHIKFESSKIYFSKSFFVLPH